MPVNARLESSFHQLCLRLLDIDSECSHTKGCPADFAARPMIESWRDVQEGELPEAIATVLKQMIGAYSDGRSCEFIDIRFLALRYLCTTVVPK